MATYKVPQDVEADDKLIGPFSFRQFIYLIIVVLAGVGAWGLAQLFIGLAIIPLPIILLFGALALPLRKDQPMEIYLAAMISFYIKPHKRLWDPEGIETLIEITAPKTYEENRTKGLSQNEAEQRLSYLANIVDSGGWAIRGTNAAPNSSVNNDIFLEAQGAVDVLDANTFIAQSFDEKMAVTSIRAKEEAVERMRSAAYAPTLPPPPPVPYVPVVPTEQPLTAFNLPTPMPAADIAMPEFDPYPTSIQQTVIQPLNDPTHMVEYDEPIITTAPVYNEPKTVETNAPITVKPTESEEFPTTTSETPVSADIINLANNADGLSIETVAHEANRIQKKIDQESEEVVISLR